jgi:hypothetical protein
MTASPSSAPNGDRMSDKALSLGFDDASDVRAQLDSEVEALLNEQKALSVKVPAPPWAWKRTMRARVNPYRRYQRTANKGHPGGKRNPTNPGNIDTSGPGWRGAPSSQPCCLGNDPSTQQRRGRWSCTTTWSPLRRAATGCGRTHRRGSTSAGSQSKGGRVRSTSLVRSEQPTGGGRCETRWAWCHASPARPRNGPVAPAARCPGCTG